MIKILYFTDTHIRSNNPSSRIDNYQESILNKFKEISEIGKSENVDFYVHGGDIVDRPDIPILTMRAFNKVLINFGKPIFLVPGNHDIYAYNLNSIGRTVLALLEDLDVFNIMMGKYPVYLSKDNTSVELHFVPYTFDLDTPVGRSKYITTDKKADFSILFAHGMLIDKPFKMINHTLIDDIKETKSDITLSGHYHTGFPIQKIDNKYFYNPGSIARLAATQPEIERKPKVVIIELKHGEEPIIRDINLKSALPGEMVLDRTNLEIKKIDKIRYDNLKTLIETSANSDYINVRKIIDSVAKDDNIDINIRNYALKLIEEVETSV